MGTLAFDRSRDKNSRDDPRRVSDVRRQSVFVRVADKLSSGALKRLGGLKYLRSLSRGRLPVVDAVDGTVTLAREVNRVDLHISRRQSSASGGQGNRVDLHISRRQSSASGGAVAGRAAAASMVEVETPVRPRAVSSPRRQSRQVLHKSRSTSALLRGVAAGQMQGAGGPVRTNRLSITHNPSAVVASQSRSRAGSTSSGGGGADPARRVSVEGMLAAGGYSKPVSTMKREARAARMTKLPSSEKSSRKFMLSQLGEAAVEQEEA